MVAVGDNMVSPLEPYSLFTTDPVLADAVEREGGGRGSDDELLFDFGAQMRSAEVFVDAPSHDPGSERRLFWRTVPLDGTYLPSGPTKPSNDLQRHSMKPITTREQR